MPRNTPAEIDSKTFTRNFNGKLSKADKALVAKATRLLKTQASQSDVAAILKEALNSVPEKYTPAQIARAIIAAVPKLKTRAVRSAKKSAGVTLHQLS